MELIDLFYSMSVSLPDAAYHLPEMFFEDRETAIDTLICSGVIYRNPTTDELFTKVFGLWLVFPVDYFVDLIWSMRSEEELAKKYRILAKLDFKFVDIFY